MLFTGAKVTHLNLLPQGQPERFHRARSMVRQMDEEGFGGCTNHGECEYACPQEISIKVIGELNKEHRKAMIEKLRRRRGFMKPQQQGGHSIESAPCRLADQSMTSS